MALSVVNNTAAFNTYRNLSATQSTLSKSLEKLSSGYRINRAADDAAGLAISEGLRSQVNGLNQAVRNAQDGVSVVQTAEGALNESTAILQRMRTLAVQGASDSNGTAARANIQAEVDQLVSELDRIAKSTTFGDTHLIDGTGTVLKFQVGANQGDEIEVDASGIDATSATLGVDALDFTTQAGASAAITTINTAIGTVSTARSTLGAVQNRFEHTVNNLNVAVENLTASESRIRDTDMASEMVKFTSSQILAQAGTAMLAQAKNLPQSVLSLLQN